jgi:hypothetical protein
VRRRECLLLSPATFCGCQKDGCHPTARDRSRAVQQSACRAHDSRPRRPSSRRTRATVNAPHWVPTTKIG